MTGRGKAAGPWPSHDGPGMGPRMPGMPAATMAYARGNYHRRRDGANAAQPIRGAM